MSKESKVQDPKTPVRCGTFCLCVFIAVLIGISAELIYKVESGIAMAAAWWIFAIWSVGIFYEGGWTRWLREWWRRNVRGYKAQFELDAEGKLVRQIFPYSVGVRQNEYATSKPGDQPVIIMRLSGWGPVAPTLWIGQVLFERKWRVEAYFGSFSRSDFFGPFRAHPSVELYQGDYGSRLRLTVVDALRIIEKLTVISPNGQVTVESFSAIVMGNRPSPFKVVED
ncbi:MAG: hypothetical protein WCV83_01920 [Candidatus Magasanikbacteria bacterium]|jgi:hypothetical protein